MRKPMFMVMTMFLHYWGVGPTQTLAKGLKAALDVQRHGLGD
jgi:hypothetical protein